MFCSAVFTAADVADNTFVFVPPTLLRALLNAVLRLTLLLRSLAMLVEAANDAVGTPEAGAVIVVGVPD